MAAGSPIRANLTIALALVFTAPLARAQSNEPARAPVHARKAAAAREKTESDRRARAHFRVGREHYESGRFEQAAREFETAHRLSRRPELLYNAYLAYRSSGRRRPAADALRAYLAVVPRQPRAKPLRARLRALERALHEEERSSAPVLRIEPVRTDPVDEPARMLEQPERSPPEARLRPEHP